MFKSIIAISISSFCILLANLYISTYFYNQIDNPHYADGTGISVVIIMSLAFGFGPLFVFLISFLIGKIINKITH